jgi:hypothetical protein
MLPVESCEMRKCDRAKIESGNSIENLEFFIYGHIYHSTNSCRKNVQKIATL